MPISSVSICTVAFAGGPPRHSWQRWHFIAFHQRLDQVIAGQKLAFWPCRLNQN